MLVERAADNMKSQFEARRQAIHVYLPAEPVLIDGDTTRLDQVLTNLLSNANKYTGERGTIEFRVEPADLQSSETPTAVVRVRDDGQGIDAELIPRLFELFTQADRSLAHSQGGLGIGLSLVRTLIELHGGTVSAHSDGHNLGSEFVLRIPMPMDVNYAAAGEAARPVEPIPVVGRRILIVDDNVDISESSEILLT
jgi:signal transduction histidine kinase